MECVMQKEELTQKVLEGWSIQELAAEFGKGKATIRYWLKRYQLITNGKSGAKKTIDASLDNKHSKKCTRCNKDKNVIDFFIRKDRSAYSSYCRQCNTDLSLVRETTTKLACIEYLGNKCIKCGIEDHYSIYDFHHTEPEHKDFSIRSHKSKSFLSVKKELDKCELLCANCHHKTHNELKNDAGYFNKIKNNTELWNDNKYRKLFFKNKLSCEICNYNDYVGALQIIFPEGQEHLRKYNKTHWDDEFKSQLALAKVRCYNCSRKHNSADVTNELELTNDKAS